MNKAQLIESIQKALGKEATKKCAGDALAAVLESIVKGVKKDKNVQLIGFGTFKVSSRKARKGSKSDQLHVLVFLHTLDDGVEHGSQAVARAFLGGFFSEGFLYGFDEFGFVHGIVGFELSVRPASWNAYRCGISSDSPF